jgi:hypothetical protein
VPSSVTGVFLPVSSRAPLYGWARKGKRTHQKVPRNWAKNITLISSIGKERGIGASLVVEGSTNGTVFETYLKDVLLPTLKHRRADRKPPHRLFFQFPSSEAPFCSHRLIIDGEN